LLQYQFDELGSRLYHLFQQGLCYYSPNNIVRKDQIFC
jgi:hypothetical protein